MRVLKSSRYSPQVRIYLESVMKSGKDYLPVLMSDGVRMRGLFGVCIKLYMRILSAAGISYCTLMSKTSYIILLLLYEKNIEMPKNSIMKVCQVVLNFLILALQFLLFLS